MICTDFLIHLTVRRPLYITLVFSTKAQRFLRVGLEVPLSGPIACLRRMVADEGKLSPDQVGGDLRAQCCCPLVAREGLNLIKANKKLPPFSQNTKYPL